MEFIRPDPISVQIIPACLSYLYQPSKSVSRVASTSALVRDSRTAPRPSRQRSLSRCSRMRTKRWPERTLLFLSKERILLNISSATSVELLTSALPTCTRLYSEPGRRSGVAFRCVVRARIALIIEFVLFAGLIGLCNLDQKPKCVCRIIALS